MHFDTVVFWLFFAVAWVVWRRLPFGAAKFGTLLLSLLFYGWWRWEYLILIVASTAFDFLAGARIHAAQRPRVRNAWLGFSLLSNLGMLAFFKYTPFVTTSLADLTGWFRAEDLPWLQGWVIPVGISFYTFQTLSYSIDIHRGVLEPCESFVDFFLFVSFFPQLVAGPIVRASEFLPQLHQRRPLRLVAVQRGLYCIAQGMFLKIVVADRLGPVVGKLYDPEVVPTLSPVKAWLAVTYFGAQVYSDFAGYSGIAIGLAYLMGLRFPENFRYPFLSQSLAEMWTRWHITLSHWIRDYVFIPLGGSRVSPPRRALNVVVTMTAAGLWHGPAWTFVAWGALHGIALALEGWIGVRRARTGPPGSAREWGRRLMGMAWAVGWFHLALAVFRGATLHSSGQMLWRMFVAPFTELRLGLRDLATAQHLWLVMPIVVLHLGQLMHEWYGFQKTPTRRALLAAGYLFGLTYFPRFNSSDFFYFQF